MVRVLLVRHAIAEDRDEVAQAGLPDARRALTEKGIRRMRGVATGLRAAMEPPERIFHSPLRRAVETADILATAFPAAPLRETATLAPGAEGTRLDALLGTVAHSVVAIVGHEPDLGAWLGRALQGEAARALPLKKAGAALVVFPEDICPAGARLEWFLPPRLGRVLGAQR